MDIFFLAEIARTAGAYMREAIAETASTTKSNSKDFVTVADIKSQGILMKLLHERYPDAIVVSEESPDAEQEAMFAPDFSGFVLDPIDGTYNFKRDMRESAVSIGYIERGEPLMGVIYDPYKDELFAAAKGQGTTRNGQPIRVSQQVTIAGASIATSNSYDDEAMVRNLRRHLAIYEHSGHMPWTSCPGSGVLIGAGVACGRFDAYHHNGLKPWDNAAMFLLVREAGGVVEALAEDRPAHWFEASVLISNKYLASTMREVFVALDPVLLT